MNLKDSFLAWGLKAPARKRKRRLSVELDAVRTPFPRGLHSDPALLHNDSYVRQKEKRLLQIGRGQSNQKGMNNVLPVKAPPFNLSLYMPVPIPYSPSMSQVQQRRQGLWLPATWASLAAICIPMRHPWVKGTLVRQWDRKAETGFPCDLHCRDKSAIKCRVLGLPRYIRRS